jgi:hypothetical protein
MKLYSGCLHTPHNCQIFMPIFFVQHEVCTHALRFRNEWMQPWAGVDGNRNRRLEFKLGLTTSRNVAATEEGLASLNGLLNKTNQKRSLVFPALMYLSASAGEGRTFAELFEYLSDFVESPSVRFGLCRKAKAGSGSERASIGRLQIYFEGAVEILRLVLDAKEKDKNSSSVGIRFDPVPMHCGRVSVVDALRLSETMNRRQCLLPHFLRTPEQCRDYVRCLESIAKLNGICVATLKETKISVMNAQTTLPKGLKDSAEYPQHPVPLKATFLPQLTEKGKSELQHPATSLNETEQCTHLPVIKSEALTLQALEAPIEGFFVMTNAFDPARPCKRLTPANDEQIIYRPSKSETNIFCHTFSEPMSPASRQLREWRDGLVQIATDFEREQKIKKILENRKQRYCDASAHKGVNVRRHKLQQNCDELASKAGIDGFSGNPGRRDSREICFTTAIWTNWRKKCSLAFESVEAAQRIQSWYRALQPRHSLRVVRRGVTLMAAIARRLYQQKRTNGGKPELLLSYVTPIPSESERAFLKAVTLGQLEKAKQCLRKYSSPGSCRTISDSQQHSGSSRNKIGNISSQIAGNQSLGIDIRVRNEHGHGAINIAARNGKLKMLQWLHESLGLSLRSKANNGHSAAALAAKNGHLDVLKYIFEKCMDDLPSSGKYIDWNCVAVASMGCPSVTTAHWISYSNLGPKKLITPEVASSLRDYLKRQQMEGRAEETGVPS